MVAVGHSGGYGCQGGGDEVLGDHRVEAVGIDIDVVDGASVESCHGVERIGDENGGGSTCARDEVDSVILEIPKDVGTAGIAPGYRKAVEAGVYNMDVFGRSTRHLIEYYVVDVGAIHWRLEWCFEGYVAVGASVSRHPHRMVRIVAKRFDSDGIHSDEGIGVGRVAHYTYHDE